MRLTPICIVKPKNSVPILLRLRRHQRHRQLIDQPIRFVQRVQSEIPARLLSSCICQLDQLCSLSSVDASWIRFYFRILKNLFHQAMERIHLQLFMFFTISSLCSISLQASINEKLYNSEVTRAIDISSQMVKSNVIVSLENTGETSARSFHVPVDAVLSNYLAYISASVRCVFIQF